MHRLLVIYCFIVFTLSVNVNLFAQADSAISQKTFEEIKEKLPLDQVKSTLVLRDQFKPKPRENKPQPKRNQGRLFSEILNLFAYLAILALAILMIYFIFNRIKINKKIEATDTGLYDIEDLEEIDANSGLELALKQGDYRMAIRMKFIKLLQVLQNQDWIDWRPEKTNKDYLREINLSIDKKSFRKLSGYYELVWYGNTNINRDNYTDLEKQFNHFMNHILDSKIS